MARKIRGHASTSSRLEPRLISILTDLASLLLKSGYGISALTRLVKRAYMDAAISLGDEAGQKRNFARIAAVTGLTRTEVSQLSKSSARGEFQPDLPANRAQRVSFGWIRDRQYCDRLGRPKILPFSSSRVSFEKLVRKYSGDIPARAMFMEMCRLGMVRASDKQKVQLVRIDSAHSYSAATSLRAISPWVEFLAEADRENARQLDANTVRIDLLFDSLPQLFAAVRDIQSRGQVFVNGINELGAKAKSAHAYELNVSIALATRVPRLEESTKMHRRSTSHDRPPVQHKER